MRRQAEAESQRWLDAAAARTRFRFENVSIVIEKSQVGSEITN